MVDRVGDRSAFNRAETRYPTAMSEIDPAALHRQAQEQLQRFIVQDGLYRWLDLSTDEGKIIDNMIGNEIFFTFDLYCPTCKMVTPYQIRTAAVTNRSIATRYQTDTLRKPVVVLNAVCLRVQHLMAVVLYQQKGRLIKIGQYPSLADIAFGELSKLDRSLEPLDRKELGRALGLFAHDAPLGAFVYLRRVFERMIARAYVRHVAEGGDEVQNFEGLKMDQRLKVVRGQLPRKVAQNSNVFGVLSKGIHELSDEEGRDLFPLVKTVIFQMLGDEERDRLAKEQEAATDAALADVIARMSTQSGEGEAATTNQ